MCGIELLPQAAIGSASSSHGLGMDEGGSLAGKESANVLSMLCSRLQGLGFRRRAWRRVVSACSGEMVTAAASLYPMNCVSQSKRSGLLQLANAAGRSGRLKQPKKHKRYYPGQGRPRKLRGWITYRF